MAEDYGDHGAEQLPAAYSKGRTKNYLLKKVHCKEMVAGQDKIKRMWFQVR